MQEQIYDAIVIGAGLGGLLSAAQLAQRGKRVVVLERLPHSGGRFTAKTFQATQVSTGAVHMVPFGSSGVLAHMLRRLHIPHHFFDADVFASFHVHGHMSARTNISRPDLEPIRNHRRNIVKHRLTCGPTWLILAAANCIDMLAPDG